MSLLLFLFIYVLGGLTFLPLLLALVFFHAYLVLPAVSPEYQSSDDFSSRSKSSSENSRDQSSTDALEEKFKRFHESDVAAGYFAICTNYTPAGINGKPPERTTPAGEVVAAESPGYYTAVYRSFFERRSGTPTLEPAKSKDGKTVKRALNVFYVVLRLGHLVLFDDDQMIEPRFVIPVANHSVSIYAGPDVNPVPEGELWIKRNAICLTPKPFLRTNSDKEPTKYYIFSDDCSKKEDFYFALLQNIEQGGSGAESPPKPQQFDVEHIVTLVKKLHSSEQQLQTRWVNALMGRLFLALYRTSFLEEHFRRKITKKIARVPKPNFITKLELQSIDLGEGAPFITNPRLKDLTVDGDCCVEADVNYAGNVRVVISATARIDLGQRFKAREVDLVLAVVIKKLEGHGLLRFKPPPSNRIWVTFERMPNIEMKIEPIVSTRQVTYSIVLQAIEKRIRETFAESLVFPFWDDTPFYETYDQHFRGGIWGPSSESSSKASKQDTPDGPDSEFETLVGNASSVSMPAMAPFSSKSLKSRRSAQSTQALVEPDNGDSSGVDKPQKPPRVIRSQSFASAADPVATPDNANVELDQKTPQRKNRSSADAASVLKAINQSQPSSPTNTPMGSPPNEPTHLSMSRGQSRSASSGSSRNGTVTDSTSHTDSLQVSTSSTLGLTDRPPSSKSSLGEESKRSSMIESVTRSLTPSDKKPTTTIGAATAAAKQWGFNMLSKREQSKKQNYPPVADRAGTPENPIGRGRPLPPPGTPLPPPERSGTKISLASSTPSIPKRKPVPPSPSPQHPPPLPERQQEMPAPRPVPVPPLPPRRPSHGIIEREKADNDELLVVAAPLESGPPSPLAEERDIVGEYDVDDETKDVVKQEEAPESEKVHVLDDPQQEEQQLPGGIIGYDNNEQDDDDVPKTLVLPDDDRPTSSESSIFLRSRLSTSPEEEGRTLPSWSAAEEEESRSKTLWTLPDNEHS